MATRTAAWPCHPDSGLWDPPGFRCAARAIAAAAGPLYALVMPDILSLGELLIDFCSTVPDVPIAQAPAFLAQRGGPP